MNLPGTPGFNLGAKSRQHDVIDVATARCSRMCNNASLLYSCMRRRSQLKRGPVRRSPSARVRARLSHPMLHRASHLPRFRDVVYQCRRRLSASLSRRRLQVEVYQTRFFFSWIPCIGDITPTCMRAIHHRAMYSFRQKCTACSAAVLQ